jgi:hypothetical protein
MRDAKYDGYWLQVLHNIQDISNQRRILKIYSTVRQFAKMHKGNQGADDIQSPIDHDFTLRRSECIALAGQ